ncbi:histidine kinase N-terminal 7TM domain-containing protein [Cohnella yongneupensis]|uniref:histidine kinase n=1 Tax=Cohnella yongneupensis TaxID=425006 RepID=A0ABW0R6N3_9BACL
MNYNLYLSVLLIAATCSALVMVYLSWKRREHPIAISYGLAVLAGAFYTFGYAFEIVSPNLEHIRFWLRFEYIGIPFGPVLWFIMVLQYTGRQSLVRKRLVVPLLVVPIVTFAAHYTNAWHHWFYAKITLEESEGSTLVSLSKGPLYEVHVVYSYILVVIGMGLLIQMLRRSTPPMKKQVAFMMIGSCSIYGFSLVYLIGVIDVPIDLSPFGFVVSGVFYLWGIYQFNMLRLAPLALQRVFESMTEAVIVFDLDNALTSYNQSAGRAIEGLHRKQLGLPADQVFVRYPLLLERLRHGSFSLRKVQIVGQPDEPFYNVNMSFVCDNHGKPVGKMLLLSDVTESVRTEERLLDNARQLGELNTFKDKMFNVIAHDIRDPLAVLVNLMELMEDEIQGCERDHEEIVHEMGQQIQNTFTLVESLLDWFRSQRGGMVFNPIERDLGHTVQNNIRMMRVRSESKRIRIVSEIPQDTFVYADKEMLDLIVRNLLSNAIKFTAADGSILVKAHRSGNRTIVAVSDTGEGISEDQAPTLLQEAYPTSSAGTAGERGVGLGLTLCREFVRLNGGEIWFDSTLSQGSTFYFSLPDPSESTRISSSSMEGAAV